MTQIVLVTYSLDRGGTDRVAWQLAAGMQQAGLDVTLLSCTSTGALDALFTGSQPGPVRYRSLSDRKWRSRTWGQIRTFGAWRRWLRDNQPDVVLATGNNISWFAGLGAIGMGRGRLRLFIKTTNPVVREQDSAFISAIRRTIYGWLFRHADRILTLSEAESGVLSQQFPDASPKFRAVYNPYLTADFERHVPARQPQVSGNDVQLLAAGRLTTQKNFARLLRALAIALENNPQSTACLSIAGDGKEKENLVALAQQLGIAGSVHFLGHVNTLSDLMSRSDMFILSSDYEGLPAVVIEALACDCPVIATDCFPSARELLTPLPGCAVTDRSEQALGAAIGHAIASLAEHNPGRPSLRSVALQYSTQSSVESHVKAMDVDIPLLQPDRHANTAPY